MAWALAVLVVAAPLLAGCDDDTLTPVQQSEQEALFDRYVALGNSITAGFQANGISPTTQNESYAVRLADQMETPFSIPGLNAPGCPPPVQNILTGARPGNATGATCGLRSLPAPLVVNNVAVPGAKVIDALSNDAAASSANALTQFLLGDRTQVGTAAEANPTFASVWLGNNDVLGAALSGNTDLITSQDAFEDQYTNVLDGLEAAGAEGGVLVSVANVTFIPHLITGQAFAAAENQINQFGQTVASQDPQATWGSFSVNDNCVPNDPSGTVRVSFQYAFGGLFAIALADQDVELDCEDNRPLGVIYQNLPLEQIGIGEAVAAQSILTAAETGEVVSALQAYNSFIQQQADDRGWAYVDVNTALGALYAAGANTPDRSDDLVPKFPQLNSVINPDVSTFGAFFSEDGVHPSGATHQVVTNLFIAAVNQQYDTSLEPIEAPDVPAP